MSPDVIAQLCATLFSAILHLGGYALPHVSPVIVRVAHSDIEARACKGPCAARAVYVPEEKQIYIDAALDPEHDVYARSILLHELVHYVQALNGRFAGLSRCDAWNAREREAYAIQNAYLELARSGMHVGNAFIAQCSKEQS